MNRRSLILAAGLVAVAIALTPVRSAAQLPFDVNQDDLAAVDSLAFQWQRLSTSVGGAEGELHYVVEEATEGVCRAVAVLGMIQLRNRYVQRAGERPVTLRMQLLCGMTLRGHVEYDGVNTRLELRERSSGELVYRERIRGLP